MRDTPPDEERGVADATSRHARLTLTFVHDDFAYGKEFLGGERLVEEVRDILVRFHEGNDDLVVLEELADPKHLSVAMFHAAVVRVIVPGVNGAHVVEMKVRWWRVILKGELGVQAPQVDRFLGRLDRGHELGLAGRECDNGLSF